jgi:hypothetical protein
MLARTMSVELHVILDGSRLPDVRRWQQSIIELGFDAQLDPALNVAGDSGFVPAVLKGSPSGFEFDLSPARDIADTYPELRTQIAARDRAANFRFGGDLSEMACAMVASAALAKLADGIWFDPQDSTTSYTVEEAVEQAKSAVASV